MWVRIDRMRIWIQYIKITKLISNYILKVKKKKIQSVPKPHRLATFLVSYLKYNFLQNYPIKFPLHFKPQDPDPRTQMNANPTGSGSYHCFNKCALE